MANIVNQVAELLEQNKSNTYKLQELLSSHIHQVETTDNDYYNNTSQKIAAEIDNIKNKINNLIIGYENINKSVGLIEALEKVLAAMKEEQVETPKSAMPINRMYNPNNVVIPSRVSEPVIEEPKQQVNSLGSTSEIVSSPFISGERLVKKISNDKPRVVMSLESTYLKYYNSEKRKQRLANKLLNLDQHKQTNNNFNINEVQF